MPEVDAVVVGSGPNGLTAAVRLAEAGMSVLVLEAADRPGGGLRTEELTLPGFRHDVCSSAHPLAQASEAFRRLSLEADGLRFCQPEAAVGHPLVPGRSVLLWRDIESTVAQLGPDAAVYRSVVGRLTRRWRSVVEGALDPLAMPPRTPVVTAAFGAAGVWGATGVNRVVLRDEPARALLAGLAAHATLDLRQPLTTGIGLLLGLLGHAVGWPVAAGGSQAIADALIRRLEARGGSVRTGHRVRSLHDLPSHRAVVLDLTPRQVVEVAADRLPTGYSSRLSRWRYGSGAFKVDWALDGPVPWVDEHLASAGTLHLVGSSAEAAASERDVAAGRVPARPYVLAVQPSLVDPSRAPAGRHTFWAYCHVPNGCDVDMTDAIEAQIERFAPGFSERILDRHVMSPRAMQAHNANYVGGDIAGGASDWRQLAARPVPSLRPWATPNPRLFLCSSSTPPGGGVHGMGGWHAAREVLRRHS
jgi:phytoene dehydrogenase-like protein